MLIAYSSFTGKVDKFVRKLGLPILRIQADTSIDEPFVMVTYTCGSGEVPEHVMRFLVNNRQHLRGVAASGSRNWPLFAYAADRISDRFGVPLLHKFELAGRPSDVQYLLERVKDLELH
ncbi:protein involved in ribonucleotide reduction [Paenibacillus sp. UNC496MF]|uniref:class Ib ribonucleoside-diphosphate reductase assembly flavoprotein NrdI n=1 Tax=Paenibacillus sp. UNC496MF TaxID=1502753 RepID=UPI0008E51B82|nr:class Ib ribonucleoside-diphosphate reductase assembly flavoprotein NrdI [Paenibacillus sp. UNC496MF]SFJ65395.1 protein involved in ribonucleotide reduction [Paenibacillus sp. UNC496MF]